MSDSKKLSNHSSLHIGFDGTALFRKTDGIGRYTYNLLSHYLSEFPDHTVTVVGFIDDDKTGCHIFKEHKNVNLVRLPFPRKLYQVLYSRFIRIPVDWLLPSFDAYVSTNFIRYPYIKKVPALTVIHDLAYIRHPEVIESKNLRYLQKNVPLTIRDDIPIAASSFTKNEIEALFHPNKSIPLVSNGVDSRLITTYTKKRKKYILAVGTLEPRKNLRRLLRAYEALPEDLKTEYKLLIVGNGGWGDQPAPQQSGVTYTGYVDDETLTNLYREASLFIFPSTYEGFGLPLLEAVAAGTPIACSDIPPFRDIMGESAAFFNPTSIASITQALTASLYEQKTRYSSVVQQEIIKKYDWKQSARQLSRAICDILE